MDTSIVVALITSGATLLGVILTQRDTLNKIQQQIMINQAVTDTKIEELTREVHEHNNFAKRMPVVENEINHLTNDIQHLKEFHECG